MVLLEISSFVSESKLFPTSTIIIVLSMNSTSKNWIIKDSLFYPLGLFNNASRSKTVFVTWSYNTLFTYIFKKVASSNSLKDTYKIQLQDTIRDIIATEFNTLCLTQSGYVYYFASCKSLKRLEYLDGVRCITKTSNGFAIIKVTKKNRIVLEIYNDFNDHSNSGRGRRCFDISFDEENLLNSCWKDDVFCIYSVKITVENTKFFERIAKQPISGNEFFMFTINNSLFGMVDNNSSDNKDSVIFLIHTLPSEIDLVRFMNDDNAIFIFMKCGVLEMIFESKLSTTLGRAIHIIDSDMISTTMADNCFFYSDGLRVVKCSPYYDEQNHTISIKKDEKLIKGIIAVTWVSTMKKLICLSENNIFYRLKFENSNAHYEDDAFTELTDDKIKEIEEHFIKLTKLADEPNKIQNNVKKECQKQEIISIYGRKEMYEELVEAKINYHKNLPTVSGLVIYPNHHQALTKNTYFALIDIEVKKNAIFRNSLWRITFEILDDTYVYKSIIVSSSILEKAFQVLLQLEKNEILIIPEIRIALTSYINVGNDFMYVSLPAKIQNIDIENLFSSTLRILMDPNEKNINEKICELFEKNSTEKCMQLNFSSKLKTPLLISIEELYQTFDISIVGSIENLTNCFTVYLLGVKINLEYLEIENMIEITSDDPGAIFYTKKFLSKKLYNELYNDEQFSLENDLRSLMKLKAELGAKCSPNELNIWSTNLKKFYAVIRKGTYTKL